MKNKILITICVIIIAIAGITYMKKTLRENATTFDMATDVSNTIITGIRDSENLDKYKYIAIPDNNKRVNGNIRYPYKDVKEIGENAFQDNTYIKEVYIPANIECIQKNAFKGCSNIESVSFGGNEAQWQKIRIESGNEEIIYAPKEYNAKMPISN